MTLRGNNLWKPQMKTWSNYPNNYCSNCVWPILPNDEKLLFSVGKQDSSDWEEGQISSPASCSQEVTTALRSDQAAQGFIQMGSDTSKERGFTTSLDYSCQCQRQILLSDVQWQDKKQLSQNKDRKLTNQKNFFFFFFLSQLGFSNTGTGCPERFAEFLSW